jgi:hypothetical protein
MASGWVELQLAATVCDVSRHVPVGQTVCDSRCDNGRWRWQPTNKSVARSMVVVRGVRKSRRGVRAVDSPGPGRWVRCPRVGDAIAQCSGSGIRLRGRGDERDDVSLIRVPTYIHTYTYIVQCAVHLCMACAGAVTERGTYDKHMLLARHQTSKSWKLNTVARCTTTM